MKYYSHSLSATQGLAVLIMFALISAGAQAAAKITLSGEAAGVRYETDAGIRISLIDWSASEQQAAVEEAWRQYGQDSDLEAFLEVAEAQDTRGYLFSASAAGYRIKYAWEEVTDNGRMMHFLVMPGLKTRTRTCGRCRTMIRRPSRWYRSGWTMSPGWRNRPWTATSSSTKRASWRWTGSTRSASLPR